MKMRKLIEDHENNVMLYKKYDPIYRQASYLRINFFKQQIVNQNTNHFKTLDERDWAYIAKREYNYGVLLRSAGYGFFCGNIALSLATFFKKKLVIAPLFIVGPIAFLGFKEYFFFKMNKRLFDMCNLGEEFELGFLRNEVLRKCNEIQDCEDF